MRKNKKINECNRVENKRKRVHDEYFNIAAGGTLFQRGEGYGYRITCSTGYSVQTSRMFFGVPENELSVNISAWLI
jgi:hypothetical protein